MYALTKSCLRSLFVLTLITCSPLAVEVYEIELERLENENWWAGLISESHLMPVGASEYAFDFFANTAGNQGQPLLISDQGRFIWCEGPFEFQIRESSVFATSSFARVEAGSSGKTLREVYQYVNRKYFPPSGRIPDPVLFTHPQFNTWIELTYNQNQKEVLEYARSAVNNGFPPGVLMIDEGWADSYGDWDFAGTRFENPSAMVRELHDLGFKVMLWVCPYITPDGPFYKDLFLKQRQDKRSVWILNESKPEFPAIMQWWDGFSAVVDLTNPDGRTWFKGKLEYLISTYGIDGFKFDGGDAVHYSASRMLSKTRSYDRGITPNGHSEKFGRLGLDYPLNEFRATWKMGGQPLAQRLRDKEHSWSDLKKLIPGSINQGLMGYPFTCPDLIGGGEYLSFLDLDEVDQELIVRAAQCHALMPMMQFSVAPWRVLDKNNLAICLEMAKLHADMGEEILKLARESARTGEPIVRCLEYEFPHRGYVGINDQFLLGSSILVAPVLEKGARTRQVVFPEGRWKSDDGTAVHGPATLEIEVPLERLPWYRRIDLKQ